MSKPLAVELGGVSVVWAQNFKQDWVTFSAGPYISEAEIILFNSFRLDGRLAGFTNTNPGGPTAILVFHSPPPYSAGHIKQHVQDFLSVRRILKSPTQPEAVDLLAHENDLVREYAREHWVEWRKQWLVTAERDRKKVWGEMLKKARQKPPTQ